MTTEARKAFRALGIGSGITLMTILGAIWWAAAQGCDKVIDPHIMSIASKVDSVKIIPMIKETRAIVDSVRCDYKVIKSILEVMATNDQLIEAQRRRNGEVWR